jgi:DNA-binding NtrC family response regulator
MDPLMNHQNSECGDPQRRAATGNLLIVEPEELVRWSLVTYLSRSFSVFTADSNDAAIRVLSEHDIDAVVIADDVTDPAGAQIEGLARTRNADVKVVWTLSHSRSTKAFPPGTLAVEKPFELEHLAGLLQGNNQTVGGGAEENSCSPKTT